MIYGQRVGTSTFSRKIFAAIVWVLLSQAPLVLCSAVAQTSPHPSFEVASLRKTAETGRLTFVRFAPLREGGRLTWDAPLSEYLKYAYHVPRWRISGLDVMLTSYTLAATMDPDASEEQVRLMLQTLLTDRFAIASHWETRSCTGYRLTVDDKGPKLKMAAASGELPPMPDYRLGTPLELFAGRILTEGLGLGILGITGRGVTISQLVDELSQELGECVTDQTGLAGKYYFGFQFASVSHPSDGADSPSIFSAIKSELGLRLEKQKGMVEILVLDHYEKTPTED